MSLRHDDPLAAERRIAVVLDVESSSVVASTLPWLFYTTGEDPFTEGAEVAAWWRAGPRGPGQPSPPVLRNPTSAPLARPALIEHSKHLRVMSRRPDQIVFDAFTPPVPIAPGQPVELRVEVDYERLYFGYRARSLPLNAAPRGECLEAALPVEPRGAASGDGFHALGGVR